MAIQIDQSWKIEYTEKETVIADSLGNSILISAKNKREIQNIFRLAYKQRIFVYETFAILIAIIVANNKENYQGQVVEIDIEYPGWDDQIKDYLLKTLRKMGINFPSQSITFKLITKQSLAHNNAYLTFKGKKNPSKNVSLEEIMKLIV